MTTYVALRLFVADCAEDVWQYLEDEPSRLACAWAIDVARRFAHGECDADELDAAEATAWATAWATARAAGRATARGAAWAAAWAVARAAQSKRLHNALLALGPRGAE